MILKKSEVFWKTWAWRPWRFKFWFERVTDCRKN